MNKLILFYNYPEISQEVKDHSPCHHIDKLRCSKANELSPDDCVNIQKCKLYLNKDLLFYDVGIDVKQLQILDNELRAKKD